MTHVEEAGGEIWIRLVSFALSYLKLDMAELIEQLAEHPRSSFDAPEDLDSFLSELETLLAVRAAKERRCQLEEILYCWLGPELRLFDRPYEGAADCFCYAAVPPEPISKRLENFPGLGNDGDDGVRTLRAGRELLFPHLQEPHRRSHQVDAGSRLHQHARLHEPRVGAGLIEDVSEAREEGGHKDIEVRFDRRHFEHSDHSAQTLHHVLQDLPRDPVHLAHDALNQLLHQRRVAEVETSPGADLPEGPSSVLARVGVDERGEDVLEGGAQQGRILREAPRVVLYDLEGRGDDQLVLRDGAGEDEVSQQVRHSR
mmetsp:Transcript_23172/g.75395  ORF Transcript_23172/g.75395 Transcript_23172/m.75395 type:complete len:314 (-) Transcript_23172:1543-2484(-)